MATDNFLTTKSILGLAERVVNCPPPEILVLDPIDGQWGGGGSEGRWGAYVDRMTTNDLQNYQLIPKLSVGQSILFQFNAQDIGETITIPITLFCIDNNNYLLRHMFYWNGDMVSAELDYNPNGQIAFSLGGTSFQ